MNETIKHSYGDVLMRIFLMTLVMNHTLFNYIVPSDSTVAVYFVRYSEWVFECECNCL